MPPPSTTATIRMSRTLPAARPASCFRRGLGGYCADTAWPGNGVRLLRPRRPAHRRVPPGRGRYCRLQFVTLGASHGGLCRWEDSMTVALVLAGSLGEDDAGQQQEMLC